VIKALVFVVFIVSAILRHPVHSGQGFLTREALSHLVESAGIWDPLLFISVYAVGVCLFVPGLCSLPWAAIFGAYFGFLYVWIGAMIGASVAFWIGRTLAEICGFHGRRSPQKVRDAVARNGLVTVLYLTLVYFPFTPMNFDGSHEGTVPDYFAGTGLGILLGLFIFTFFIGTLKEVWASGHWVNYFPSSFLLCRLFLFPFSFQESSRF